LGKPMQGAEIIDLRREMERELRKI